MKRVEITYRSYANELSKLSTRLERAEKTYQKKLAAAEKFGVANWTADDRSAWLETVPKSDWGQLLNKSDIKIHGAWWDLVRAKNEVEDLKGQIERAEKRFEKATEAVIAYQEELKKITDAKEMERLMQEEFEKEQKEWAKDGITLETRYTGKTPKGKGFGIWENNGYTERSWHCYSLVIDGEMIFTSGEFWRAYAVVKNS